MYPGEEWAFGGVMIFFYLGLLSTNLQLVNVFLDVTPLNYNSDFPKHILYFNASIPLGIEPKTNVCKTDVCSIYVLFSGEWEGASKVVLLD